jgi:hypothetical protein
VDLKKNIVAGCELIPLPQDYNHLRGFVKAAVSSRVSLERLCPTELVIPQVLFIKEEAMSSRFLEVEK